MTWFKFDDAWYGHPKVTKLSDRAIVMFVLAGTWSSHYLTDGEIPSHVFPLIRYNAAAAAELVDCGLWHKTEDGYAFSSWREYQPTKAKVEKTREVWRGNMAVARAAKNSDTEYSDEFAQFWKVYPRKKAKPTAYSAWKRAVKREHLDTIMDGLLKWRELWDDPQFIPYPATWLNRDGWDDEPDAPSPQKQSRFDQNAGKLAELERRSHNADDAVGRREITDNHGGS